MIDLIASLIYESFKLLQKRRFRALHIYDKDKDIYDKDYYL